MRATSPMLTPAALGEALRRDRGVRTSARSNETSHALIAKPSLMTASRHRRTSDNVSWLSPSRVFGPRWPVWCTCDGRPRSPRYVRYASRVRGRPASKIGDRNGTTRRLSIARTEFARPAPPLRPSTYTSWNQASVTCSTVNRTRASGTGGRADGVRARRDGSPSPRTASRDGSGSPAARFATARAHQALACALVSNIS